MLVTLLGNFAEVFTSSNTCYIKLLIKFVRVVLCYLLENGLSLLDWAPAAKNITSQDTKYYHDVAILITYSTYTI